MGEKNYEIFTWQGIDIQNIKRTQKNNKNLNNIIKNRQMM
jgi:hypothetical protein